MSIEQLTKQQIYMLFIIFLILFYNCNVEAKKQNCNNIPELNLKFEKYQLKNGLTVILHEDESNPIVAMRMVYRAGFSNEIESKTYGSANVMLRLMEKGSKNYSQNFNRALEQIGAVDIDNFVNEDTIVFSSVLPVESLEQALWFESERLANIINSITDERLEEQLTLNEKVIEKNSQNFDAIVKNRISEQSFFAKHPYARINNGLADRETGPSLHQLRRWSKNYIRPNNSILVLSGMFNIEEIKPIIKKYFGYIESSQPVAQMYISEQTKSNMKKDHINVVNGHNELIYVWNLPKDIPITFEELNVLFNLLVSNQGGRLYQNLLEKNDFVQNISIEFNERLLSTQVLLRITLKNQSSISDIEKILINEINLLANKVVSKKELNQSICNVLFSYLKKIDTVKGKSETLALGEIFQQDPKTLHLDFEKLRDINNKQIKKIATYIKNPDYFLSTSAIMPYTHEFNSGVRVKPDTAKKYAKISFPKIEEFTLHNNLKVTLIKQPHISLTHASLLFYVGASNHGGLFGITKLAFNHFIDKVTPKDKKTFFNYAYLEHADVTLNVDLDTSTLQFSALNASLPKLFNSLGEVFSRSSQISEHELSIYKEKEIKNIEQLKQDKVQHGMYIMPKLLYEKKHPYSVPWTGLASSTSLNKIQPKDVLLFEQKWLRPDNARLTLVTSLSAKEVKSMLNNSFAKWKAPITSVPSKNATMAKINLGNNVYIMDESSSKQAVIFAGQKTVPSNSDNIHTLTLINKIFGVGNTSRLSDIYGLDFESTTAYSKLYNFKLDNPLIVVVQTSSNEIYKAIRQLRSALQHLGKNKPFTKEEVSWNKHSFIQSLPSKLANSHEKILLMEYFKINNIPTKWLNELSTSYAQISEKAVNKVTDEILSASNFVWLIIGDKKAFEDKLDLLEFNEIIEL